MKAAPPVTLVGLDTFRAAAKHAATLTDAERVEALAGLAPMKGFLPQVKVLDEKERIIRFTISTDSVDRMGDTVSVKGWDLNDFIRGGQPVLFGHDRWSPVVGRGVSTAIGPEGLISDCQFTPRELSPFGFMVYGLYAADYMRATSVGFLPLEFSFAEDRGMGGINFLRQQLLEYSMVPVPANPDCLSQAKAAGLDVAPMREWASKSLDLMARMSPAGPPADRMLADSLERLRSVCDDAQIRYFLPSTEAEDMDPKLTASIEALEATVKALPDAISAAVAKAVALKSTPEPEPPAPAPVVAEPAATSDPAPAPVADATSAAEAAPVDPPPAPVVAEPEPVAPVADPPAPVEAAAADVHVLMLDHEIEIGIDLSADDIREVIAATTREAVMQHTGRLD